MGLTSETWASNYKSVELGQMGGVDLERQFQSDRQTAQLGDNPAVPRNKVQGN